MEQLTQAQHKAAEALYKQAGASGGAQAGEPAGDRKAPRRRRPADDVIDAEVVEDEKKVVDLYIVLGLQHGATESDIKRAYRRLARRFHPDINPGDRTAEARFRQILEAYETLIDRERRSRYDAGQRPADAVAAAEAAGSRGSTSRRAGVDYSATFGDLFAEVLSEREQRPARGERGADLHQDVSMSFEDALLGGERAVTVSRDDVCATCGGRGVAQSTPAACGMCQGAGAVRTVRGHMVFSRSCTACGGAGQQRPRACRTCGGTGQVMRTETVVARIPPGVADGERVRVPEQGRRRVRGGRRATCTSRCTSRPTRSSAATATTCTWRCRSRSTRRRSARASRSTGLDGPVRVRVPPGTQSGQRFRLRERGVPSTRDGRPRRSGRRGAADAAGGARRTLEGAAAGVRADERGAAVGRSERE